MKNSNPISREVLVKITETKTRLTKIKRKENEKAHKLAKNQILVTKKQWCVNCILLLVVAKSWFVLCVQSSDDEDIQKLRMAVKHFIFHAIYLVIPEIINIFEAIPVPIQRANAKRVKLKNCTELFKQTGKCVHQIQQKNLRTSLFPHNEKVCPSRNLLIPT